MTPRTSTFAARGVAPVESQELLALPPAPPPPSRHDGASSHGLAQPPHPKLTTSQAWNLYASHLLSTWNARTYEFAAIIFTAAAYPDTLTASAIRGIITTISSILLSTSIGRWIDRAPDRLKTLLSTIAVNRCSVIAACVGWFFIVGAESAGLQEGGLLSTSGYQETLSGLVRGSIFAVVLFLGILEKSSGAANMISMERDWVVTVANTDGEVYDLTHLNAVMRRIDLLCKLVAPIVTSVVVSGIGTVRAGVLVVSSMSAASWVVEWWSAKKVWNNHAGLQQLKILPTIDASINSSEDNARLPSWTTISQRGNSFVGRAIEWRQRYAQGFRTYFSSDVWIPSLALSLLHLSVLSYSATFITYLLSVGFSLNLITLARAIGSVVEVSSTIVTPFGVSYLGKAHHHHHRISDQDDFEEDEEETEMASVEHGPIQDVSTQTGLERLGLWGITWQLLNLVPVVLSLWALSSSSLPGSTPSLFSPLFSRLATLSTIPSIVLLSLTLFTFLSLSRLGLWIYDLTTQQLTQMRVTPSSRASFSGVEASFVAFFELGQHVATLALNKPEDFRWLAVGSLCAVAVSSVAYAGWVREKRGHLVHWDRLVGLGAKCGWERRGRRLDR